MSILVDINGTILQEGKPIHPTIEYLKGIEEDIYVISGSTVSKLEYYSTVLTNLGINYKQIILNPINEHTDHSFKTNWASQIPNLTLAIDNNKKILALYSKMGIPVMHPDEIRNGGQLIATPL
jgi:hypothetical protein